MPRAARWPLPLLAIALLSAAPAQAQESPPSRSDVIDRAGLFEPEPLLQARKRLIAIEKKSSVPIVIETVESLKGEPIDDAALKAARSSGGLGLFLFIAKDEHKLAKPLVRRQFDYRFPADRKEAIRDAMLDRFKAGDFNDGLKRGIDAIEKTLDETAKAPVPSASPSQGKPGTDHPAIVRDQARLTLAGARLVLAAAEARASEKGLKMNLAVVDDGGHPLAFARMDGARPASAATAQAKAASAATFRQETGPTGSGLATHEAVISLGLAIASDGKITPLQGGVPIVVDGQVVGALGVAGGTGDQDAEIARHGASALGEEAKKTPEK